MRKVEKNGLSQEQTIEVSCPYCGTSCDMDDNYCWKCGKRVGQSVEVGDHGISKAIHAATGTEQDGASKGISV